MFSSSVSISASFSTLFLSEIDDLVALDRPRQAPAQSRLGRFLETAELEYYATLRRVDDVEAATQPDRRHQHQDEPNAPTKLPRTDRWHAVAALPTPSTGTLVAEQAGQAAIEIAPEFFEVGRALIAAALAATGLIAPAVVVERHENSGDHLCLCFG
jgi:hypothetical protein